MKASEILHGLAELLAGIEGQQAQAQPNRAELVQVDVSNTDGTDREVSGIFVPPLQAKLELLKKSTGVDSVYDQDGGDDITRMKQLSGIAAQDEAANDEPLDV